MSIRPFILGLALAAPLFAQANYSINNSVFSCSTALSFANSTGLDAHCTGNFSVTGGTWTSDTKIALSADGTLTLDGVVMTAPVIELNSLTQVALLGDSLIRATGSNPRSDTIFDGFGQVPGTVDLQPGADLSVGGGSNLNALGTGSGLVTGSFFGEPSIGGSILINGRTPVRTPFLQVTGLQSASSSITTDSSQTPLIWGAVVPEPETYALALATLGTGAALARRRKA
jgi:PEP-CTERM motif